MDRKFVIFIVASVVILFFSNSFFNKKPSRPQPQPMTQSVPTEVSDPNTKISSIPKSENGNENSKNEIVVFENDALKVVNSTIGAKIDEITIKKFNKEYNIINLSSNLGDFDSFILNMSENNNDMRLDSRNWKITAEKNLITYTHNFENKLIIDKKIEFNKNYHSNIKISLDNISKDKLNINNIMLHFGLAASTKTSQYHQVVIFSDNKITRIEPKKNDETKIFEIKNGWVGIRDQYFCYIFKSEMINQVVLKNNMSKNMDVFINFKDVSLEPGKSSVYDIKSYFGPQNYSELKKSGEKLNKIVDFGFFHSIGVLMLYCLNFFYNLTNNYGLAIILLTVLIRALLWWPTQKSYTSMKKMQTSMNKMQPRLKTLKEIYRDNPQKLNEETMKLYKEYQINPMGGCLPMLLQMPIFFALYSTLNSAVELKGAGFIWVWKDLSLKDPIYVLPVLMGASMFIQQKMSTPPAATPEAEAQQKMMLYLMPAMLTFFAFMWPAGLLVYWVVSNGISIFQQMIINRQS